MWRPVYFLVLLSLWCQWFRLAGNDRDEGVITVLFAMMHRYARYAEQPAQHRQVAFRLPHPVEHPDQVR